MLTSSIEATLGRHVRWNIVDCPDDGDKPDPHRDDARGNEPRPDEFKRSDQLPPVNGPDGYEPYHFRVERAGKAPATKSGSWIHAANRLVVDEPVGWMEQGGNVGAVESDN